jgi:hypothetical protein
MLQTIATLLGASNEELSKSREKAEQTPCLNHLRQLALAVHNHAQAHDGRLDFNARTAMKALLPFPGE